MFRKKNLKWMVGASMLAVMLAAVGVVHGGGRWSGIDPILTVDGHQVNIIVSTSQGSWCDLDTIAVEVSVPQGSDTQFISESSGADCGIVTSTTIVENEDPNDQGLYFTTVPIQSGGKKVQVDTEVYVDSRLVGIFFGDMNVIYTAGPIYLDQQGVTECVTDPTTYCTFYTYIAYDSSIATDADKVKGKKK